LSVSVRVAARAQAGIFGPGGKGEEAEMRLTIRDGLATLFVAAAAAVYLAWVTGAAMTGWSVRVTAAVVFGLGFVACLTDQRQMAVVYGAAREGPPPSAAYVVVASVGGGLALVTGVIALVTGSAAMLAVLAASVAGLWVIAMARHALVPGSRSPSRRSAKTA
jgi:hypothetical protein